MISGFGGGVRVAPTNVDSVHFASNLPVPFNIPKVLHNLLFEETGITFDAKQQDMLETLRFSYDALLRLEENHAKKSETLRLKLLETPDDLEIKASFEELRLDMLQAKFQFKELLGVMSELMKRSQYEQLLAFSKIGV